MKVEIAKCHEYQENHIGINFSEIARLNTYAARCGMAGIELHHLAIEAAPRAHMNLGRLSIRFINAALMGAAICAFSGGAIAQTQQPTTPAPSNAARPAGNQSPSGPAATFSDSEIEQFAKAAMAIQKIQQDTAAAESEKQPQMAAAVQASGLTPQRFNEIAAASQSDSALMQRIQTAAGKLQNAPTQ